MMLKSFYSFSVRFSNEVPKTWDIETFPDSSPMAFIISPKEN